MRRREFITLLGGATVAWPHTARTQQPALLRNSQTVGTSGSAAERVELVTASARKLPDLTYSIEDETLPNITCTCPPMRPPTPGL